MPALLTSRSSRPYASSTAANRGPTAVGIVQVGGYGQSSVSGRLAAPDHPVGGVETVPVADRHVIAGRGQGHCRRGADAAATAGDEGDSSAGHEISLSGRTFDRVGHGSWVEAWRGRACRTSGSPCKKRRRTSSSDSSGSGAPAVCGAAPSRIARSPNASRPTIRDLPCESFPATWRMTQQESRSTAALAAMWRMTTSTPRAVRRAKRPRVWRTARRRPPGRRGCRTRRSGRRTSRRSGRTPAPD